MYRGISLLELWNVSDRRIDVSRPTFCIFKPIYLSIYLSIQRWILYNASEETNIPKVKRERNAFSKPVSLKRGGRHEIENNRGNRSPLVIENPLFVRGRPRSLLSR